MGWLGLKVNPYGEEKLTEWIYVITLINYANSLDGDIGDVHPTSDRKSCCVPAFELCILLHYIVYYDLKYINNVIFCNKKSLATQHCPLECDFIHYYHAFEIFVTNDDKQVEFQNFTLSSVRYNVIYECYRS